jgi:hypothetical protein
LSAKEKDIEFHGYHVSAMDEGVTYDIKQGDDFEIDCNIDTSHIDTHPGGTVSISLGEITASLNEKGGDIKVGWKTMAKVGSKFRLKMSLTDGGHYELHVDGQKVGSKDAPVNGPVQVKFGLKHQSHYCNRLSHVYISNITMSQRSNPGGDANSETETWE